MNIENIRQLIEVIEAQEEQKSDYALGGFCMAFYQFNCGCPACIGGWSAFLQNDRYPIDKDVDIPYFAAVWLGIDEGWATHNLFNPPKYNLYHLKKDRAILALQRLMEAGENYRNLTQEDLWAILPAHDDSQDNR